MSSTPVFATPDFGKTFIVECDTSRKWIGLVLMQEGRPLAFESKKFNESYLVKYTYEK
jgi:hypothetical protein